MSFKSNNRDVFLIILTLENYLSILCYQLFIDIVIQMVCYYHFIEVKL